MAGGELIDGPGWASSAWAGAFLARPGSSEWRRGLRRPGCLRPRPARTPPRGLGRERHLLDSRPCWAVGPL